MREIVDAMIEIINENKRHHPEKHEYKIRYDLIRKWSKELEQANIDWI